MSFLSEAELLRGCRRGEAEAWNELFERHYAAAARFIQQLSSALSHEDVEEISQETFLTVIQSIASFQGQSRFQTWLFRIACNKTHDHLDRQRAAKRGGGQTPLSLQAEEADGLTLDTPSPAPTPDLALVHAENLALVGEALEQLGGPCQEIIELRYFADLSYEEIADSLALKPKTVSSRLSKCLDKLEIVMTKLFSREKSRPLSV